MSLVMYLTSKGLRYSTIIKIFTQVFLCVCVFVFFLANKQFFQHYPRNNPSSLK